LHLLQTTHYLFSLFTRKNCTYRLPCLHISTILRNKLLERQNFYLKQNGSREE
jgi:hypothetical protein